MADVNANINISLDTSQAQAQLHQLQSQISAFNQSFTAINSQGAQQAQAMNRALMDGINATKMFNARIVPVVSTVDRFSNALDKGKLSLGEYSRYTASQLPGMRKVFASEFQMMEKVVTDRVKKMQTQYLALGKSARGMQEAMAITPATLRGGYGTEMAMATQRAQIFNKLIDDGSTKLLNWGKNTQWAGRQLMVGFSLPLAALGTVAAQTFMELDKVGVAFERVYGDLSTTTAEMERNKAAVMDLGKEYTKYGISVADTIDLGSRVAATGLEGTDMLAATEQTLRFATLGQMDYNTALDATISLQSAFKVESQDLANKIDFLNAVENQTVLTIQDIAAAIPRVAPVIKGLGGDIEDLAVMLTAMREGGVSAEQGANALKSGLASLINPTNRAKESLAQLGINMDSIIQQNKGDLLGTVKAFGEALSVVGEFEQQQALEQIFGKYQYARMGALFDNIADSSSQASRAMDLMGMSMEELAALSEKELSKIEESTTVKFQKALEQLRLSIAPLGEAFLKGIMPIMEFLSNIANAFNNLPDPIKNAVAVITGVIGGLGPVFLMTIGLIGNGMANLVKGIQFFRKTLARIKGDAENFKYLGTAELEARGATEALEGSVQGLTGSLLLQKSALQGLIREYERYAAVAGIAGAATRRRAGGGAPQLKMANGGVVPGTGSGDKIPALLEPGETVITKKASQKYAPVIEAMNAGTLPGYQGGLNLPTGMTVRRGSEQTIERFLRAIQKISGASEIAAQVLKEMSESAVTANRAEIQRRMEAKGFEMPALTSSQRTAAAHLTERGTGLSAGGRALLGKSGSQSAAGILAMGQDPELSRHIREYSGLTADLTQNMNTQLQNGVAVNRFMQEWSQYDDKLLPSLQKFGGLIDVNSKDIDALSAFERELGDNVQRRAISQNDGIVDDAMLSDETQKLIAKYKDAEGSIGKVARAADKAATQIGQVGIAMSKVEAQRLADRVEDTGEELRYMRGGAVLGRESKSSGTFRPERIGKLARDEARIFATAYDAERTRILSKPQSDTYMQARSGRNSPHYQASRDGKQDGQAYINARKAELAKLRTARGMSPTQLATTQLLEDKRRFSDQRRMSKSGMTQTQIERVERRLLESKIREEKVQAAKLRSAQRAAVAAQQSAAAAAKNAATEQQIGRTLSQRLRSSVAGAGGRFAGRAGTIGMGLGMASMVPFMAQNEEGKFAGMDANALGMGMMGTGMAFDFIGMAKLAGGGGLLAKVAAGLTAFAGPLAIATAGITAFAIGMKIWRNNVDEAARKASDFGANLGATANALNTAATLTGTATPVQRQTQLDLNLGQQLSEGVAQWNATFEDGAGKKFIDDLKEATSEQRFQKLGDVIRYAIAAGTMDAAQARDFSDAVALALGDTALGLRARAVASQAQQGSESFLGIARGRSQSLQQGTAFRELTTAQVVASERQRYAAQARAQRQANLGPQVNPQGEVDFEAGLDKVTISSESAATIVGGSLQAIQDFANAAALAGEEFEAGKISQEQYNSMAQESRDGIDGFTVKLREALEAAQDTGAAMESLRYQLESTGIITAEEAKAISELAGLTTGTNEQNQVVGISAETVRAAAGGAVMGGMGVDQIKAIDEYMRGEQGVKTRQRFADIAQGENAAQAYGLAGLQMSMEQGGIPSVIGATEKETQANIERVMDITVEIVDEGGSVAEFQQFLATVPQTLNIEAEFEGMDAAEKKQYMDDFNNLAEDIGTEMASKVVQSTAYDKDREKVLKASGDLQKIFGQDQETIDKYINIALEEDPEGLLNELPNTIENLTALDQIPPDIRSLIGIELTNPDDVEKYGPMAEGILQLVPALEAVPDEQKEVAAGLMTKTNGKVKDPIAFAKDVAEYQKALNQLSDDKVEVRKEAALKLLTTITGPNGESINPKDADGAFQRILDNTGLTEAEFLQLPQDTISKIIGFQVQIDGAAQSAEAMRQSAVVALAMGDTAAYDRYMSAAEALDKLKANQKATAAAGIVTGGNQLPSTTGGGSGGDKSNPFKDLKKALLDQIKMYSDAEQSMKTLFSSKTRFFDLIKKNQGIDDKIRKLNLAPALAEQIASMDPADAKKVINRISKNGKLTAEGRQINRVALAGQVSQRTDEARSRINAVNAQRAALTSLRGRGAASSEAIGAIAGDPEAAKEYVALVKEAKRAESDWKDAGSKHQGKLWKEWKKSEEAVDKYINKIVAAQRQEQAVSTATSMATETARNQEAATALASVIDLPNISEDVKNWVQENPAQLADLITFYKGDVDKAIAEIQSSINALDALKSPGDKMMEEIDAARQPILDNFEAMKSEFEMIFVGIEQKYEDLMEATRNRISSIQDEISAIEDEIAAIEKLNKADQRRIRDLEKQKEAIQRQVEEIERSNELDQRRVDALNRQSELIQRSVDQLNRQNELDQRRVDALQRQQEMMQRQSDHIQDQIDIAERANELDQRKIENLQREDEMRQRISESLSHELDLMSRAEEKIRSNYDIRIKKLDEISSIQDKINKQQQSQLDLAKALSQGDIYAATAAAQQMRQTQIQNATEGTRAALEQGMESQIGGLRTSGGLSRQQAEEQIQAIQDQSYQTNLAIRDIQDEIYNRTQALIPLRDQIYNIDQSIKGVNEEILTIQDQMYERELAQIPYMDQIYNIGLETRNIEDEIYDRNLNIIPLKDNIRLIDLDIRDIQDDIYDRETQILDIQRDRLDPKQEQLRKENDILKQQQAQMEQEKANVKVNGLTFKQLQQQIQSEAAIYAYTASQIKLNNKNANSVAQIANIWNAVGQRINEANSAARSMYATARNMATIRAAQFVPDPDSMLPVAQQAKLYQEDVDRWLSDELAKIDAARNSAVNAALSEGRQARSAGGMIEGAGARDSVSALLTPGEFVIRKSMVDKYGIPFFNDINSGAFKKPRFDIDPKMFARANASIDDSTKSAENISSPVYNTYSVNVNVPNAQVNADEVAMKVMQKIKTIESSSVRSYRGF